MSTLFLCLNASVVDAPDGVHYIGVGGGLTIPLVGAGSGQGYLSGYVSMRFVLFGVSALRARNEELGVGFLFLAPKF